MALDAETALADALEAHHTNADYAEVLSAPKCRAYITACRRLLALLPTQVGTRNANTTMDVKLIAADMKSAEAWLAANPSAGSGQVSGYTTRADFRNFRQ